MMFARREFLNAGYYQILSDRVNQLALQYASSAQQILDIGCGEGYYSHRLYNALVAHHFCYLQGVDISKSAIKYAAKRYPNLSFCVASAYEMPIPSNSIDLAIRIYAPSKVEELQRIMAPSGILITVSPGPLHHFALKQQIYDQPRLHPESEARVDGFECLHQERLSAQLDLNDSKDIGNFLEMTPMRGSLPQSRNKHFLSAD